MRRAQTSFARMYPLRRKQGIHERFHRSSYLNDTYLPQQYPIKATNLEDTFLLPNIENPFDARRIVAVNTETDQRYYLSSRAEKYRKSLHKDLYPIGALTWKTSPVAALMFPSAPGFDHFSASAVLQQLRQVRRCTTKFFPTGKDDDYEIMDESCYLAEPLKDTVDTLRFIVAITTMNNTFVLHKQKNLHDLVVENDYWRGYSLSLSSCLHRATWQWSKQELVGLPKHNKNDKYLGIITEARACLQNHPLCAKTKYISGKGRPGIYILEPASFKVLRSVNQKVVEHVFTWDEYAAWKHEARNDLNRQQAWNRYKGQE